MGSAIAYLIASKTNAKVTLFDIYPESLKKSQASVEKYGKSSLDKGFITEERLAEVKKQIAWTDKLEDAKTADLVIDIAYSSGRAPFRICEAGRSKLIPHKFPTLAGYY